MNVFPSKSWLQLTGHKNLKQPNTSFTYPIYEAIGFAVINMLFDKRKMQ